MGIEILVCQGISQPCDVKCTPTTVFSAPCLPRISGLTSKLDGDRMVTMTSDINHDSKGVENKIFFELLPW